MPAGRSTPPRIRDRALGGAAPGAWFAVAVVALALFLPLASITLPGFQVQVVHMKGTPARSYVSSGEVREVEGRVKFSLRPDADGERTPVNVAMDDVREIETRWTLQHYRDVFGDARLWRVLRNSVVMAFVGALAALLFGLPVAWALARVALPGWRFLAGLALGPAILPPFFIALGGVRTLQDTLMETFGWQGDVLQVAVATLVFGSVLYPFVVLFVAPVWARIPAGPHEAALLLRGRRAAFFTVVWPRIRGPVLAAFLVAFVLAITDFAVPDLLGFLQPDGNNAAPVFITDVRLAWEKEGNMGRAVATAAPLMVVTIGLVICAAWLLARRAYVASESLRLRPRRRGLARPAALLILAAVLAISLVLPLVQIAGWTTSGESSSAGTAAATERIDNSGELFAFTAALDATAGIRAERTRWLQIGLGAALVSMLIAWPLARRFLRGGPGWRAFVWVAGLLPLALPGIVLGIGTIAFWNLAAPDVATQSLVRPVLVLVARFLPFALMAGWLAQRATRVDQEEVGGTLGAGPWRRA